MSTRWDSPEDYNIEDMYAEKFDDMDWKDLVKDMIAYFEMKPYELDSFKEWWIHREVCNHDKDHDSYLSDKAWADYSS
jgi:hypothetical protein